MKNTGLSRLPLVVLVLVACGGPTARVDTNPPSATGPVGMVLHALPEPIDTQARYLIYLHNRFAETAMAGDVHPTFGPYDYQGILDSMAQRGFIVFAETRQPNADPDAWATRVSHQVESLISAGVPPEKITVVGFSKGGAIAILASSNLANDSVNFVFLAACGDWIGRLPGLEPRGRLLSIVEAGDSLATSCSGLFALAPEGTVHEETELRIGGGHGAFFTPRAEWLQPLIQWASEISFDE